MSRAPEPVIKVIQVPFTRAMIIRAVVKALCLFVIFNLVYGLIQPVQKGLLPSLYNTLLVGRKRLIKGFEYDAYRLISDHVISTARSDTFNIVMLGSSEIWGSRTGPNESIPAYLEAVGLVAADGRPVRVYNLGYPFPNAFKDLTLLEAVMRRHIPIDLVILSTFDTTLSAKVHVISSANLTLETYIIDHYDLPSAYLDPKSIPDNLFNAALLSPLNDQNALSAWVSMQMRGLIWSLIGDDADQSTAIFRNRAKLMTSFLNPLTFDRVNPENTLLQAFAQVERETNIPIVILDAPAPVESNEFAPWLHEQTHALGLPMIECWDIYRNPDAFEDYFHITPEMHEPYARALAKALNDPAFEGVVAGLPLDLPSDFVMPAETCAVYAT